MSSNPGGGATAAARVRVKPDTAGSTEAEDALAADAELACLAGELECVVKRRFGGAEEALLAEERLGRRCAAVAGG